MAAAAHILQIGYHCSLSFGAEHLSCCSEQVSDLGNSVRSTVAGKPNLLAEQACW